MRGGGEGRRSRQAPVNSSYLMPDKAPQQPLPRLANSETHLPLVPVCFFFTMRGEPTDPRLVRPDSVADVGA